MSDAGARILAGDIGGTKTSLGLFKAVNGRIEKEREEVFINSAFPSAAEIISAFLKKGPSSHIASAAFGIACPVEKNRCRMTNLDWAVDGEALATALGIERVALINDLVATAWGLKQLPPESICTINTGETGIGNAVLIAAGTGLGEAMLVWNGTEHVPSGSEGGHADFAPRTDVQIELLKYLKGLHGHVSCERVLSGAGLENIYNFLNRKNGRTVPDSMIERFIADGAGSVISDEALKSGDATCVAALELFISIYGAEAGNLALKGMAVGGVYIGGGIAPKVLAAFKGGAFMDAFADKGRFSPFMRRMPVRLILDEKTALIGAAFYAGRALTGR